MKYILSASNSQYFITAINLIFSLEKSVEKDFTFIFYDLGLCADQLDLLKKIGNRLRFPLEIEIFKADEFPSFVLPESGSYAWKPIIINKTLQEKKSKVLYLDSANLIHSDISPIWQEIELNGLFTPICGSGKLKEWTHPDTFKFFEPINAETIRNRCGGLCGFNYNNELVRLLVAKWEKYALIKECIIPEESDRTNHRHDQSILTILLNQPKYSALKLTNAEVNISSANPISAISVRNKLPENFPTSLLWLSRLYFRVRFSIDVLINKFTK